MASIDKVSTGWRARWRTPDGQSRSKTFARKADATNHLTSVDSSKLMGAYIDPSAGRVSFKSYAEQWRASQVHRSRTSDHVESNLRLHVYPRIGHRPIGSIRTNEIQALIKAMEVGTGERPPLAPSTIGTAYVWVATIFEAAVTDRVIGLTPCRKVKLPQVEETKVVPLALETVEALAAAVPDRYRALIVLGAGAGPRLGEALGLTLDRVDFLRRTVTIDRQLLRSGGSGPVFGPVKDRKNRPRTIPLPSVVGDALAVHLRKWPAGPQGLIFTSNSGGPIRRTPWGDMWRAAAEPLGIAKGDGYHQLRHFYASLLIRHGESVKVVQERLGHASAQITMDTYAHLWPDSDDSTRAAVDSVLGNSAVSGACQPQTGDS